MAKIQLRNTATQEIYNCVMWEEALLTTDKNTLKQGNIVAVKEFDYNEKYNNYTIVETGMIIKNKDFQKVWINHIQWGFSWANKNGFTELAHIIAFHHGIKEWNTLVEPLTPEANLVHQIDMISSRLGMISFGEF